MITQFQVHSYFIEQLPKPLRRRVSTKGISEKPLTAKDTILVFSEYTRSMAVGRDFVRTKQCLMVAEQLYQNGDVVVRTLVESAYVYLLTSFLKTFAKDRPRWENIIPQGLKQTYGSHAHTRRDPEPTEEVGEGELESEGEH